MARMSFFRALLPMLLATASCGDKGNRNQAAADATQSEIATGDTSVLSESERTTLAAIEALGDEHAAVVVVHPHRWGELYKQIGYIADQLPPRLQDALKTPEGTLSFILRKARLRIEITALEGWDRSRPLVLGLARSPNSGPRGVSALSLFEKVGLPGLEHTAIVPADDPAKLEASLKALAKKQRTEDGKWNIEALPTAVRVSLILGKIEANKIPSKLSGTGTKAIAHTPAMLIAAREDAVVTLLVRPWRLRSLAAWSGWSMTKQAVATITPGDRELAFAKGLSLILRAELLMADEGAEVDDFAISLLGGEKQRLRTTASLTELGAKLYDAGTSGAGQRIALKAGVSPILDGQLALDIGPMLDGAQEPPELMSFERTKEAVWAIQECGSSCPVYLGTRTPVGLARSFERLARHKRGIGSPLRPLMPNATRFVVLQEDNKIGKWALAASLPGDTDIALLQKLVAKQNDERSASNKLSFATAPHGERILVMLGLLVDPKTIFEPGKSSESSPTLAEVDLNLKLFSGGRMPKELAAILQQAGSVSMRSWRSGRALVSELGIGAIDKQAPSWLQNLGAHTWGPPLSDHAASPGNKCLAEAARGISVGFAALTLAGHESYGLLVNKMLEELEPQFDCASQDAATKPMGQALRRVTVMPTITMLEKKWLKKQALTLVESQCGASKDTKICGEQERLQKLPAYNLPQLSEEALSCANPGDAMWRFGSADARVQVDATGAIYVDGHKVDAAGLKAALKAVGADPNDSDMPQEELPPTDTLPARPAPVDRHQGSIELGIAGDAKYSDVKPVLEAFAASPVASCHLIVANERGEPVELTARPAYRKGTVRDDTQAPFLYEVRGTDVRLGGSGEAFKTLDTESLRKKAQELAPDADAWVQASDTTKWSDVARTLAATCPNGKLVHSGKQSP